ncbi:MAG TPA: hypothetical protein VI749_03305 [Candidatus Omnitrophota bacterium]|nr:hypothetical protein [Candidatus Omnitrophota bacterium]
MLDKKWPVLGLVLIGLGMVNSVFTIIDSLLRLDIALIVLHAVILGVLWEVYVFSPQGLKALKIFLVIKIFLSVILILNGLPLIMGLVEIAVCAAMLYYFNSEKVAQLFKVIIKQLAQN